MAYAETIYLVRHGAETYGGLNERGFWVDAPSARDELLAHGLGEAAVILSSSSPRAAQTAIIIAEGLRTGVVLSDTMKEAGNSWGVRDLDAVVEQALYEEGIEIDPSNQDLIVVTHAPMIAIARGLDSADGVEYGEVFPYLRGSWSNPIAPKRRNS
jgi:phosphohistidine phosphatase SixA